MNRDDLAPNRRQFLGTAVAAALASNAGATPVPEILWTFDLKSPSYGGGSLANLNGTPAVVFGTYYNDEHLYALRAKDGHLIWKVNSEGGPFDASVAVADLDDDGLPEILSADSSTGALFCLDGNGKVKWKFKLPSSTDSPPAVADIDGDGKPEVVVGTMTTRDRRGRVVVLNPRSKRVVWEAPVPGHVQSEPVLVDLGHNRLDVIVTNWRGDKTVRAFNGRDGSPLWTHAMKGDMYHGVSAVNADGPKVLAASIVGDVTLLDGSGKVLWTKQPGGYLFAPTSHADLDGDGMSEFIVCGDRVHVFGNDGAERWKSDPFGSIPRGVAIAELGGKPTLFFGAADKKFRALDGATGNEVFKFDARVQDNAHEGIDSGPIIADFDGDGNLEAFFVAGKGTSDKTRPQNYGRAYCLRLGAGKRSWPMFRGNLTRTGHGG